MRKIKALLLAVVFVVFGTSAFAADATVTFVSGKVEVQRNGQWVALQKGDTVAKSETISTGFQSEAKIKILDSVMYLGPVTRITLEELSSTSKKDNVNVYLKTGAVRSQVKHVDNKRVNYQVHTAVAVASCRGTGWIMDDSNTVIVTENTVAVGIYTEPETPAVNTSLEGEASDEADSEAEEEDETLTSEDGVLVQANQSVTVTETSSVSNPVSTVEKTANDVVGIITTAAIKESEGGVGLGGGSVTAGAAGTSNGGSSSAGLPGAGSPETPTATVVVEVEAPDAN